MKSTEDFEVIVIADETTHAGYAAADLIAQAEHAPGSAVLITWNEQLVTVVASELEQAGLVVTGVLESVAMVVGRADSQTIEAVSRLEGVAAVEKSRRERAIDDDSE